MSHKPLLGCIADDFTGATDLAGMLVRAGMRTVQMIGVPIGLPPGGQQGPVGQDVDAIVIALKSRTIPAAEAVSASLAALAWLTDAGCKQFYFKYCSTFDSTDRGNIGPVADALMTALGTRFTIACPAFPENGRTIFKGHLFVGDLLLSDSGMRHHPLTPMTDANLVRVLQRQTRRKVGLIAHDVVSAGTDAMRRKMAALQAEGIEIAVVDAIDNKALMTIGAACADLPLVTAGSGVAVGLSQNFTGLTAGGADRLPTTRGVRAVISGSCSSATQEQVASAIAGGMPAFTIDPLRLAAGENLVEQALAWAKPLLASGPVLVTATAAPDEVKRIQEAIGIERAGQLVEQALAEIARGLVAAGVRQFVVAGGETSGAVVSALGVSGLVIGPQIDPGVPWTASLCSDDAARLALALKSGNFGSKDFFTKAWDLLQ
jgi:uncharacterized protein YgbK (DUF1537 family)